MRDLCCWVCSAEILRSVAIHLGHNLHECNIELQRSQRFVIEKDRARVKSEAKKRRM